MLVHTYNALQDSTMATPRPKITSVEAHILVSPNAPDIFELPVGMSKNDTPSEPRPSDATTFRWSLNPFPQLPYCLKYPRYQGPLLQRLAYTFNTLPLEWDYGWSLSPSVAESWQSLETCLETATVALFNAVGALHLLEFRVFRRPSQFGYSRKFRKSDQSRRCCINGRNAFVPLMALCSYAISITPNFTNENPPWVGKLEEMGVHPEWVQLLKSSQLADFSESNKRLGVIIQPNCKWLNRIPNMIRANVPLYFLWDDPNDFASTPWFYKKYCPTLQEVRHAQTRERLRGQPPSWEDISVTALVADDQTSDPTLVPDDATHAPDDVTLVPDIPPQQPPPSNEPPIPDQFSGQKRGETMDQFFARRVERHARMAATETSAERISRLDREQMAQRHRIPGRGGARCFTWEEVDGFMMRTYLVRSAVENCWGSYTNSQRRYDGFYNEWDLATEFDPGVVALDDDDDDDDDDVHYMPAQQRTPSPPPPYPPSSPAPPQLFVDDITTTYRSNVSESSPYHNEVCDMEIQNPGDLMDDILYWRFGYNWDGITALTDAEQSIVPWRNIQKTLTDLECNIQADQQPAITSFVTHLGNGIAVPQVLWDLNSDNPSPLRGNFNPKLVVNFKIFEQTTYYFIQSAAPSHDDPSWDLVVKDPITALECYRRDWGPSIIEVARALLHAGKPFSTCIRSDVPHRVHAPQLRRDAIGLGWRQAGYGGDANDYAGYEARRTAFLALPRGRKAALEGGIVWRLAINSIELRHVLIGPSDDVFEYGSAIACDSNGEELWDDALSESELNLICGVYNVQTHSGQTSDSSWWPKQSVWKTSGLNVGYWSVGCETWFKKRLDAIRNGTARLRTSAEWRSSLKFWRGTGPFITNSRHAAAAYLLDTPSDLFH
jgi:hypothetical protein